MKKIITLIIALLTFVSGTQVAHATLLQNLEVTLKSGMILDDENNTDIYMAFLALYLFNQIKPLAYDDAIRTWTYGSPADKVLFTMTTDGFVAVTSAITDEDDIIYTLTDKDRETLSNEDEDLYEYFRRYRTIILHFVAGDTDIQKPALVGTLKTGFKAEDDEDTYMAFCFLWQVFNQLKMSVDEEKGDVVFSSLADKVLFSFDENGIFTIAPGVSSADDIIYTITQEDRDNLMNTNMELYELVLPLSAIELHFDVEIVEPKVQAVTFDFSEITMHPGEQLLLEPRFTPEDVKDKSLRYVDISGGHNVYIDESGLVFAQSEGYAYIQAFSSYTASGDELMATWGPEQASFLKITVTSQGPGEEIFFDHKEGNGPVITYHVTDQNGKLCEVAGRYDEDDCTTLAVAESTTGIISIPEEAMGYKVTRIGAFAFYELEGITEVWLPNTIEQIGSYAFSRCYNVKHVYIPIAEPLKFTDAYGDLMDESMGHNDAFYRVGEDVDGAILHVVEGSRSAWNVYPWNEWFVRIVDDSPDGISLTPALSKSEGDCYDLSGRKIVNGKLQKGISIIRYSDGTTKKIMVR